LNNQEDDDEDEDIDQIFDEEEFNENNIQNIKSGLKNQNQSHIEYPIRSEKREPLFDL